MCSLWYNPDVCYNIWIWKKTWRIFSRLFQENPAPAIHGSTGNVFFNIIFMKPGPWLIEVWIFVYLCNKFPLIQCDSYKTTEEEMLSPDKGHSQGTVAVQWEQVWEIPWSVSAGKYDSSIFGHGGGMLTWASMHHATTCVWRYKENIYRKLFSRTDISILNCLLYNWKTISRLEKNEDCLVLKPI